MVEEGQEIWKRELRSFAGNEKGDEEEAKAKGEFSATVLQKMLED